MSEVEEMIEEANEMNRLGKLDRAVNLYSQVLDLNPDNTLIRHQLGVLYFRQGDLGKAEELLRQVIEREPENVNAYSNLCGVCIQANKLPEAHAASQKALEINPNFAETYNNIGVILLRQKEFQKALQAFQKAIKLKKDYIDPIRNIAILLFEQKKFAEAGRFFKQLRRLLPEDLWVRERLGECAIEAHQWEDAIESYEKVRETQPDTPKILTSLALAYKEIGEVEKEHEFLRKALENNPNDALNQVNMGVYYYHIGDSDKAREYYLKAVELNPYHALALKGVAYTKKFKEPNEVDDFVTKVDRALKNGKLGNRDESILYFSKGKVFNDIGRWDEAFESYKKGNELLENKFDRVKHTEIISSLKESFTEEFFEEKKGVGSNSEFPVFIVGMPRSGTSLVEQILASHPKIFGCGERPDFNSIARQISKLIHSSESYPKCLREIQSKPITDLTKQYIERGLRGQEGFERIIDKMPNNYLHLGLIALFFPNAKIIHTKRNRKDCSVSCFFQDFIRDGLGFATNLPDLGFYYAKYEELMDHWKRVLPIEIYEVEYEVLVANQEKESRKLVEFVGMEWDDACLNYHEADRMVHTASAWEVRQPIYKSSVERWRNYEKHLGPLDEAYEAEKK